MSEPSGVWVYAVLGPVDALHDLTGVAGSPVRVITGGGLSAFVSDVRLDEFGEEALQANFEDMDWLEATAKEHHQVIDTLAQTHPVVPMRLATVFAGDASVRTMLTRRGDELREVLSRIGGCKEWGVKAFATERSEAESTERSGPYEAGSAGESSSDAQEGSGAAYLRRRRDQIAVGRQTRRDAAVSAERVHVTLAELAVEARLHPPQVPQLAGTRAVMLLNAAYLLDEVGEHQFDTAVQRLASQHPAIRLQLTGPWPPYSFASLNPVGDGGERLR